MRLLPSQARFTLIVDGGAEVLRAAFARDVRAGLTASPKRLPCCYFYDVQGSRLFEAICELPEYYLTRAEREILQEHAEGLASQFPDKITLVELGSGSAAKTRILIDAFLRRHETLQYVPVDISRSALEDSARTLLQDYPDLEILAVTGEYHDGLRHLKTEGDRPKLILWLGSSIGNLDRREAATFLRHVRGAMCPQDRLLVGIDLRKDRALLEAAYDDAQGVTARFNLNILARINRELGGTFDLQGFHHRAVYDDEAGRIEMYLTNRGVQSVWIEHLGLTVLFAAGETIHTENSYKYSRGEIEALAAGAGLGMEHQWFDAGRRFSLNLLAPV